MALPVSAAKTAQARIPSKGYFLGVARAFFAGTLKAGLGDSSKKPTSRRF
jgi:hypothetical protein